MDVLLLGADGVGGDGFWALEGRWRCLISVYMDKIRIWIVWEVFRGNTWRFVLSNFQFYIQ